MESKLLYFLSILVFLTSCSQTTIIARIGDNVITAKDADLRRSVSLIFYPENRDSDLGFIQSKKAFVLAEILNKFNHKISEEVLNKEAQRIDMNTKDPLTLRKIKDLFGDNRKAYLKVFVLPVYVERVIYNDLFLHDKKIHEQTKTTATDFYNKVQVNLKNFSQLTTEMGGQFSYLLISKEQGLRWQDSIDESLNNRGPSSDAHQGIEPFKGEKVPIQIKHELDRQAQSQNLHEANLWINKLVRNTTVGHLVNKIIDRGEDWLVVRYVGNKKSTYKFEVAIFPKINFNEWVRNESEKIPIITESGRGFRLQTLFEFL